MFHTGYGIQDIPGLVDHSLITKEAINTFKTHVL